LIQDTRELNLSMSHDPDIIRGNISGYNLIISAYATFATSVSAVRTHSNQSTSAVHAIVLQGRKAFQGIIQAAGGADDSEVVRTVFLIFFLIN
jgi:hypothetical protein